MSRHPDIQGAWTVAVDGVLVGRIQASEKVLANRGRGLLSTGWPQRRGKLWAASPDGADLDAHDLDAIKSWLRRDGREKTNRDAAARELLNAYERTGVVLPEAPEAAAA